MIDVTAVSIRVQWIRGFNGGFQQTFTIRYTDVVSGVVKEKSGIEDRVVGSGQMITDDITDGIEPETEYRVLTLWAAFPESLVLNIWISHLISTTPCR